VVILTAVAPADNDIGPDGMEALAAAVHSGKTPLNMFNVDSEFASLNMFNVDDEFAMVSLCTPRRWGMKDNGQEGEGGGGIIVILVTAVGLRAS
jgi:hypothetical protein